MQGFGLAVGSNRDDLHLHLVTLPRDSKAVFDDFLSFGFQFDQFRSVEPQRNLGFAAADLGITIPAFGVAFKIRIP